MIGIVAKEKGSKKSWMAYDHMTGMFVTRLIYQPLWDEEMRGKVNGLVDKLNRENDSYEFKIVDRK